VWSDEADDQIDGGIAARVDVYPSIPRIAKVLTLIFCFTFN
jgi:hypothetical protein